MDPIIIIGAGLAGWTLVREFRKLDSTTPVMVITADSGDFYAKPTLSNAFAQKKAPEQLVVTPAGKMAETQDVTLLAHTRVLSFDASTKTVSTDKGDYKYSTLVLATGALPIRLPMAGDAAEQVLSINSLADFTRFYSALNQSRKTVISPSNESADSYKNSSKITPKIVIMGAGLIGCEFANDLANAGFSVSVVDPSNRPLAALLPEAASETLRMALQNVGVLWHLGTTVQSVDLAEDAASAALQVTLANGLTLAADVVLSAIGLRADTRLALAAGLACERGVHVNATLQTSAADVYALGDSSQYASAGNTTLPYVMPIMTAARALAQTLAGIQTAASFPIMPIAVKTPAFPLQIVPPPLGAQGQWTSPEANVWQFQTAPDKMIGFVLAAEKTAKRAEMVKLLQASLS